MGRCAEGTKLLLDSAQLQKGEEQGLKKAGAVQPVEGGAVEARPAGESCHVLSVLQLNFKNKAQRGAGFSL